MWVESATTASENNSDCKYFITSAPNSNSLERFITRNQTLNNVQYIKKLYFTLAKNTNYSKP